MVPEKRVIPKWQIELFEAWTDAGFPDHFEYTIKRGRRWGCTESVDTFPEIAKWWRKQFQKEPPKLPNPPQRKSANGKEWGDTGKDARSLYKFRRFLGQMEENDRKLLMFMAQKMAKSKRG